MGLPTNRVIVGYQQQVVGSIVMVFSCKRSRYAAVDWEKQSGISTQDTDLLNPATSAAASG